MKKLYLILVFLCLSAGLLKASSGSKSYFPDCSITVTASVASSGGSSICLGNSIGLTASVSGGTAPYTYLWTPATGLNNATIYNPVATPSVTTTYTVNVTDHVGCTGTASVTVTVNMPPVANPDTILLEYITGRPLSARGGTPPYTYTFSPPVNTNSLLSLPITNTTYTITITGANGCSSTQYANYVPLPATEACSDIYVSEYIQDTALSSLGGMNDAIELYNPTASPINLSMYYLTGTTNGSLLSPPFIIPLHGSISAYGTFLIANKNAGASLTSKANMLSDSLNFNGKDIVALARACVINNNVTFSFLDEIGAISPLPTDSGWAVGTGSTKNHTLVRHAYVTQGTLNWNTGKSEWRVCSQGTFSHIGLYNNKCAPGSPDLLLTIANPTLTCGSSQYLEFDVMASSDAPTYFDNCLMDIQYSGTAFGNNVVSNGNVTITKGANFNNATYLDPNSNAGDISPDTLNITFGIDLSQPSWTRTQIDATPQQLIHVKMKIQDCGVNAGVYSTDMSFTESFSEYTQNASDSVQYNMEYDTTYYTGGINDNTCQMTITDYTNPIDAGTNAKSVPSNSSILTINGTGFGDNESAIKVCDANSGFDGKGNEARFYLDYDDILSWSNNQIVVKMPSVVAGDTLTPGTGPFTVFNTCGDSVSANLQINYNIINYVPRGTEKYRANIVMANPSESFVWKCDTSVWNNLKARICVEKAIREWNCWTGVNWKLEGDTVLITPDTLDGISYIYIDNSILDPYIVMQTTTDHYLSCYNFADSVEFINEADIGINPNHNFSYDTTGAGYSPDSIYFYDAILHEMGHGHRLNHINDTLSLMYWNTAAYRPSIITGGTYPGPATLLGGLDVVNTSAANSPISLGCSYDILIPSTRECFYNGLGISSIPANPYSLNLYPNPSVNGNVMIHYVLTQNTYIQFKIIDCLGREITILRNENKPPGTYNQPLDVSSLAAGAYMFIANINGSVQTIKFIKL